MVSETGFLGGGGRYGDGRVGALAGSFLGGAGGTRLDGGDCSARVGVLAGGFLGGAGGGGVLPSGTRLDGGDGGGGDGRYDDDGDRGSIFPWRGSVWCGDEPAHGTGGCGVGEAKQCRAEMVVERQRAEQEEMWVEVNEHLEYLFVRASSLRAEFTPPVVSQGNTHEMFDGMSGQNGVSDDKDGDEAGAIPWLQQFSVTGAASKVLDEMHHNDVVWDKVSNEDTRVGLLQQLARGEPFPLELGRDSVNRLLDEMRNLDVIFDGESPHLDMIWDGVLLYELDSHVGLLEQLCQHGEADEQRKPLAKLDMADKLTDGEQVTFKISMPSKATTLVFDDMLLKEKQLVWGREELDGEVTNQTYFVLVKMPSWIGGGFSPWNHATRLVIEGIPAWRQCSLSPWKHEHEFKLYIEHLSWSSTLWLADKGLNRVLLNDASWLYFHVLCPLEMAIASLHFTICKRMLAWSHCNFSQGQSEQRLELHRMTKRLRDIELHISECQCQVDLGLVEVASMQIYRSRLC